MTKYYCDTCRLEVPYGQLVRIMVSTKPPPIFEGGTEVCPTCLEKIKAFMKSLGPWDREQLTNT
jgi:hypothetical protein